MKKQIAEFVVKNKKVIRRVALGAAVVVITGVVTTLLTKGEDEETYEYNDDEVFETIDVQTEE